MTDAHAEAQLLAKKIAENYQPEKIILFGSIARGDYKKDSDIDLFIIKKSDKKKAYRIKEVFETIRTIPRNYSLDAIVYTPEEIAKRLALGDYFIKRIFSEGTVLYPPDIPDYSKDEIQEAFNQAKAVKDAILSAISEEK